MTLQVNFDTIKSEIVTYKERREIMNQELYNFIKAFFHEVESGLDDAFYWIEKIFPGLAN